MITRTIAILVVEFVVLVVFGIGLHTVGSRLKRRADLTQQRRPAQSVGKRVRLLIYSGPEEWLESQRQHDGVQGFRRVDVDKLIRSIELDPQRITLLELVRLWWREARHG